MSGAALCVLLPGVAAALAAVLARGRAALWAHVAGCGATLAAALALPWARPAAGWLGDPLALGAAGLTAAVALGGAVAGLERAGDAGGAAGQDGAERFAPAAALALLGSLMLGLLADSVAAGWLAAAAAAGVASAAPLLRGGARHAGAQAEIRAEAQAKIRAEAWAEVRALALPAAGALCLSLFGTVLLAMGGAGRWDLAPGLAGRPADGAMLALGCLLLLAGHALVAGLAPLHGWLGQAQSAAPRALKVLLCAPLPGLALVWLLRAGRVAAAAGAGLPAAGLLGLGVLSVGVAGLALWRHAGGGTLRLATLLHGGVAAAGFGLGGSGAVYAGLLHLAVSGLARAAAVLAGAEPEAGPATTGFGAGPPVAAGGLPPPGAREAGGAALGRAASGGAAMGDAASGGRGWLALLVVLALAGMPPLALFPAEFLLLAEVLARRPGLAVPLVAGLLAAALGLLRRGREGGRGREGDGAGAPGGRLARAVAWALLGAATLLGLALPAWVSDGLARIAETFAARA